ncbi:MAG TPA: hypothetical protein VI451_06020 [Anaerolineales bacterium]|nr:hypothetical protein [Anaerolineales bacterium]
MTNDVINRIWKALGGKVHNNSQGQRNPYRLKMINREREQFVEILQKRYGYTKEKATSELNTHYSKVIRHD